MESKEYYESRIADLENALQKLEQTKLPDQRGKYIDRMKGLNMISEGLYFITKQIEAHKKADTKDTETYAHLLADLYAGLLQKYKEALAYIKEVVE